MPGAVIVGGGLAGLAAAAALGGAGWQVDLLEARGFPGGRATSYPLAGLASATGEEEIDNCQHILLRCCVNLVDFYRKLGVEDRIRFHREFYFIEPGGRVSTLRAGLLPAPLHFTESFLRMRCFTLKDKLSIARGLLAIRAEHNRRPDLDRITMLDWLKEKKQTPRAIDWFWAQVLVSAVNEDLDRMAASHGFQVFWLGFLADSRSYEMGVPAVPLAKLYEADSWRRFPNVRLHFREAAERIECGSDSVTGVRTRSRLWQADAYVSAVNFDRLAAIVPELEDLTEGFDVSPITGIHLWFDRPVTSLPHATLLGRTIQWVFNKEDGRYLQLVVSASRSLLPMPRQAIIELALRELAEFFPAAQEARLEKAQVIKETKATFSAVTGLRRPTAVTRFANLALAGDWTRTGWPGTMEGAVRSGYGAAEVLSRAIGQERQFVHADIA